MPLKLGRELHRVSSNGCSPHTGLSRALIYCATRKCKARQGAGNEVGPPHAPPGGRAGFCVAPAFLFSTRCGPSCRRLAAHRSPGAEDVCVSTLLPSSSSSAYRQDCATEEARPRFNILINIEVSQAGESPPRGRGTASHLSHVPAPGVTRSRLGFPPGSPGGCSGPSRGERPACPRWLPRAPRAVRPWRPRLCARFRGTALLTQKEAEPRRPASRRSREPEVSGNVALLHPLAAFG